MLALDWNDVRPVEHRGDFFSDAHSEERGHGVADLTRDRSVVAEKDELVREALEARGFSMSDWAVLGGVEIAPLFRLEKLGADRERGPVPPQPAEQVGAPGFFSLPTTGGKIGSVLEEVEAVAALRDGSITLQTGGKRSAPEVQIHRRGGVENTVTYSHRLGEVSDSSFDRFPKQHSGAMEWIVLCRVVMSRLWKFRNADSRSYHDRSFPALRDAEVGGVENPLGNAIPHSRRDRLNFGIFVRFEEFRHVLHDEDARFRASDDFHIRAPQFLARVSRTFLIEQTKPLAGRPADNDIGFGYRHRLTVIGLYAPFEDGVDVAVNAVLTEIIVVAGGRVLVEVIGENRDEAPGIDESLSKPPGTGKKIDEGVLGWSIELVGVAPVGNDAGRSRQIEFNEEVVRLARIRGDQAADVEWNIAGKNGQ